jgi:hypothetical protein
VSGGGEITTIIGVSHLDAVMRADAIRYLKRKGCADLLPILGLADAPAKPKPATGKCPICGNKLPGHGVCRRRGTCREAARKRGLVA